jgi:hypothetical protein
LINALIIKGKKYCWNPLTKKVKKITVEDIDIKKCPDDVITALMSILSESEKKAD